jgi:hypothetical protein
LKQSFPRLATVRERQSREIELPVRAPPETDSTEKTSPTSKIELRNRTVPSDRQTSSNFQSLLDAQYTTVDESAPLAETSFDTEQGKTGNAGADASTTARASKPSREPE